VPCPLERLSATDAEVLIELQPHVPVSRGMST
jgi:hypothetical protein